MIEDNKMLLGSLLAIALSSLALVGWVIYQGGDKESSNLLIMLANTVASGLVGYLTKSVISSARINQAVSANIEKEKEEKTTNEKENV